MLHNHSRRSRRCGDCNRREATRPMTSWRPLHPYTYSLDLGGAAAAGVLQEGWRQEAGAKGGASRLPLTFCLLTISGLYLGKFPQTPRCNPYSLHLPPALTSDFGDVGGEASPSCLLSPASSPPVRCPRQRCALLTKQKNHSGARRVAQDERLGWQRCSASADQGGAAADRPDSSVHLNLKPKPNPLIQLFPLCRKYDTIYTI